MIVPGVDREEQAMDEDEARELLRAERARLENLLGGTVASGSEDRAALDEVGDIADPAATLTSEQTDDAVAAGLRERLDAVARAEERLAAGTFGRSGRSGAPIPDDRRRADPAAEL